MLQLCKCTLSIASLKSVQIVVSNESRKTRPSVNTARANIPRLYRFYQILVWFISFTLDWKRSIALSVIQRSCHLAWEPNNIFPSVIWSCRTRSNSWTGLGAVKFAFCFCCLLFSPLYHSFFLFFFLSLFVSSYHFWATVVFYLIRFWYVSLTFFRFFFFLRN